MPNYYIQDINNISQKDLDALISDSENNKHIYQKVFQILSFDKILDYGEYRIISDSKFYYHGTLDKESLKELIKLDAFFIPTMFLKKESYYFRVIDCEMYSRKLNFSTLDLTRDSYSLKRIIFERVYTNYKESIFFTTKLTLCLNFLILYSRRSKLPLHIII